MGFQIPSEKIYFQTRSSTVYLLNRKQYSEILRVLYTDDFLNSIQLSNIDITNAIIKTYAFTLNLSPIINDVNTPENSFMYIGGYSHQFTDDSNCKILSENGFRYIINSPYFTLSDDIFKNIGIDISDYKSYGNYCKLYVYIPKIGFKELDISKIRNRSFKFQAFIDFYSGEITVGLIINTDFYSTPIDSEVIEEIWKTDCSIDMPLGSTNAIERIRNRNLNRINIGVSTLQSVANIVGLLGNAPSNLVVGQGISSVADIGGQIITSEYNAEYNITKAGSPMSDFDSAYSSNDIFFMSVKKNIIEPDNYAHFHGKPSMKTVNISNIADGTYFKVASCHLEIPNMKSEEIQELENLLKIGVIK